MIRSQNGTPYKLKGPNPLMRDMASPSGWDGGTWEFSNNIGEVSIEKSSVPQSPPPVNNEPLEQFGIVDFPPENTTDELKLSPKKSERPFDPLDIDVDRRFGDDEMIRNLDGTPYELGKVQHYDPTNPDHDLIDDVDRETIEIGGAPIEYYRVIVDGNVDPLFYEQMQKPFLSAPIILQAQWEPAPPDLQGLGFVYNSEESMIFNFNKNDFLELVGEMPRVGSLIKTCDEGIFWEITKISPNMEDRKMWGKHRLLVV